MTNIIANQNFAVLRQLVEESADLHLKTSNDFILLSGMIRERIKVSLGATTLKRLWGYVEGFATTREDTLNILCRFVGYPDWETFVSDYCETESAQSSHRILSECFNVDDIPLDAMVVIEWNPNRHCVIRHRGNGWFEVKESINSKLKPNDTFHCDRLIANQPLFLDNYVHDGKAPALFVIANKGGLTKITLK